MDFGMVGPALALGLGAIGAAIGCAVAGIMAIGVMSRIEEGHGKLIGLSAVPASQMIYSFVLMLLLRNAVVAGSISHISAAFIGGSSGLAIMTAAIYQGLCCSAAIQATAKQPSVFGKAFVPIGVVESFALFAFVFALLLF